MTTLKEERFRDMRKYFDGTLDHFNVKTRPGCKSLPMEEAVKWIDDKSSACALKFMGDVKGKRVLDIGCGTGAHLIWLARHGAIVTGIDISRERINVANEMIKCFSAQDKVKAIQCDADRTQFEAGSFDVIFGQDILMYFDGKYDKLIQEFKRLLAAGGVIVFSEAMARHPVARFYRNRIAPKEWKAYTRYFTLHDTGIFKDSFGNLDYRVFYLAGFPALFIKIYLKCRPFFNIFDEIAWWLDSILTALIPPLKKYAWRIVFSCRENKEAS